MNKKQRVVLGAVIIVIIAMFLFPPFYLKGPEGMTVNCGYMFISSKQCQVDTSMLLTQWIGVLIVGGIAYLMARGEPRK
jgi:hypothetical protein